jgi:hypothetical protein
MRERQPGMNPDGSYAPWKAAQTVARVKELLGAPYYVLACIDEATLKDLPKGRLMEHLTALPEEETARGYPNLAGMLDGFRRLHPKGDWLLLVKGVSRMPGVKNPAGFVDTPILEKAIAFHTNAGHPGTI